jgi:Glycosyl hydrolases family 2, TIM barrel domain
MKYSIFLVFFMLNLVMQAQVIPVQVIQDSHGKWQFIREGKPYYVNGVGGHVHLNVAKEIGANSIRTWGLENAKQILDEAHENGLTVMMGLWVQHERHGFDYNDEKKVATQLEGFKKSILELKDHPALLCWGVGNEVDLFYSNTKVWYAIEEIAKFIHEVDPNHPTCTVTAGLDEKEVVLINERAPSIDVYCINTYGDIAGVKSNLKKFGWNKAYMITEWGPNGHWEVQKTKWNAPVEQSSSEKAISYKERYQNEILADSLFCIGSYVFLWGQKQETTSTWYGLFSKNGLRSEAVDVLHAYWNPKSLKNHAPVIREATINGMHKGDFFTLSPGAKYKAQVNVVDPNNDLLKAKWIVVPESTDVKSGGDAEAEPQPVPRCFRKQSITEADFFAPTKEGAYRLFYEVSDGHEHYAYINIPFYVMPQENSNAKGRVVTFKKQVFEP